MRRGLFVFGCGLLALGVSPGRSGVAAAESESAWISTLDEEQMLSQFEANAETAGALGFYHDTDANGLVVLVPSILADSFDAAKLGPSPVPIIIKLSKVDPGELKLANERLTSFVQQLGKDESMAFYFDARTERVQVAATVDAGKLMAAIGDSQALVAFQQGSFQTQSRFNDFAPFWGGSALKYQGVGPETYDCTSGFAMKSGTTRVLVTAAHCGPVKSTVVSPDQGRVIGTAWFGHRYCPTDPSGPPSDNADVQLINNSTNSYDNTIYVGGLTGGAGIVDQPAGDPAVGVTYAVSGATTYEHTGMEVLSLGGLVSDDACGVPGSLSQMIVYAQVHNNQSTCPTQDGDSGAPFYFRYNNTPIKVAIRGMHIGKSVPQPTGTVCFAMRYTKIASVTGFTALIN